MNTAAIRQKLYEYIRVADDKKVKAIFTMVEDEVNEITNWHEDSAVISELDKRSTALKSGKDKGTTWEDAKKRILGNRAKAGKK
ncbi:MAG TPA: addiction module protein [Chitinophaga sp.]|uniref:addiction module protein n=1 Tax=Chitinophaga sp. TaxID=1869181 RepID=UPI002F95369F